MTLFSRLSLCILYGLTVTFYVMYASLLNFGRKDSLPLFSYSHSYFLSTVLSTLRYSGDRKITLSIFLSLPPPYSFDIPVSLLTYVRTYVRTYMPSHHLRFSPTLKKREMGRKKEKRRERLDNVMQTFSLSVFSFSLWRLQLCTYMYMYFCFSFFPNFFSLSLNEKKD